MSGGLRHPEDLPFTPLGGGRAAATVFACGLCGCRFTHGAEVCAACPLAASCELVKCPSCGYQFPRSSRLVDYFRALFHDRSER